MSGQACPEHVYIHVPFCGRRCSYCDFAIAVRRQVPVRAFIDAIMAEIATRRIGPRERVRSLYLGGGTPSKLGANGVAELVERLLATLAGPAGPTSPHRPEVTVEANPEDVDDSSAAVWAAAGVNRVSLGVQTFEPKVLEWMHRGHGPEAPARAVASLRKAGIANLSVDLIFALPDTQTRDWSADLRRVLELEPGHVSLYGLTVEPHTPLGRWRDRGAVREAGEERYAAEFLEADRVLTESGFEHYEVSNFGRPGFRSVHNSSYWKRVPYLGLGPSAHGFDGTRRRWNHSALVDWERALASGADPVAGSEMLTEEERAAEEVYLGLRTIDGLAIRQNESETVTPWIDAGWGRLNADRLVLTSSGWLRLDSIAASLTSVRSPS